MAPVRAVLWDADGVLQQGPASWEAALGAVIGSERVTAFGEAVWQVLEPALTGAIDMSTHLEEVVTDLGLGARRTEIFDVWRMIDPLPDSLAVVAAVRAGGTGCYLATNQDNLRASSMRTLLGYDDLLDGAYYSCDLGAAKPEATFFLGIADDLGAPPDELLFLDDLPLNVEGAREAGLRAEHWHHSDGIDALTAHLAAHDVRVG